MIRLIVAVDSKSGIAKDGRMPWSLPNELAYFHNRIRGSSIIIGHNTHNAIGRALPESHNYVCSRRSQPAKPGVTWIKDPTKFIDSFTNDLWVIGGQEIYELALPHADEVYITRIDADFSCDKFFPQLPKAFKLQSSSAPKAENGLSYHFEIWTKD
ncbi:dihydrofolate reductase [Candidatus Saccharibacteria bacterium]|jgi:dihydrofolate reductase|nr:MAG: dihydrofolate reductase [Candidatus Saccharibacteria bacterium]